MKNQNENMEKKVAPPSFIKLAMRNMVRKGSKSISHIIYMNFSEIPENPFIFLSWVTAIGLFISLSEATIKIKLEKRNSYRKRLELVNSLYPKKLA